MQRLASISWYAGMLACLVAIMAVSAETPAPDSPKNGVAATTPAVPAAANAIESPFSTAQTAKVRQIVSGLANPESYFIPPRDGVVAKVLDEMRRQGTIVYPGQPVMGEVEAKAQVKATVDAMVAEKFGSLEKQAIRWQREVEAKFPMANEGDRIVFRFIDSAKKVMTVAGVVERINQQSVVIDSRSYGFEDFAIDDPATAATLRTLDRNRTEQARQSYMKSKVDAYKKTIRDFTRDTQVEQEKSLGKVIAAGNEKRGYLYFNRQWLPLEAVAGLVYDEEAKALADAKNRWEAQQIAVAGTHLAEVNAWLMAHRYGQACLTEPSIKALLAENNGELAYSEPEKAVSETPVSKPPKHPLAATPTDMGLWNKLINSIGITAGIGILVIIACVGCIAFYYVSKKKVKEYKDRKKEEFTAAMLKYEFWRKAKSDQLHFKYASYQFKALDQAQAALRRLSFIQVNEQGEVILPEGIEHGFYEEEGRHVLYIGGPGFAYSQWREAISIFPNIPGAEYYKVSDVPTVSNEMVDAQQAIQAQASIDEDIDSRR